MNYTITPADLGDIKDIFRNFYDDTIARLLPEEQLKVRIFIEEGLIFAEDKRRLSLYEGQINRQYDIPGPLLRKLNDTHIIRAENHAGSFMYELSHDTLVEPILKARNERKEKERLIEEERQRQEELRIAKEKARKARRKLMMVVGALVIALSLTTVAVWKWMEANQQKEIANSKTREAVQQWINFLEIKKESAETAKETMMQMKNYEIANKFTLTIDSLGQKIDSLKNEIRIVPKH